MTLKLVINAHFAELGKMMDEVKSLLPFRLDITVEETDYETIPFQSFPDNDGRPSQIIDRNWYKKEITPRGYGYDIVAFVILKSQDQYLGIGGITSWNSGRYEIEFSSDDGELYPLATQPVKTKYKFSNHLIHELSHALKQMYRVMDDTHSHMWLEHFDLKAAFSFLKTKKMNQVKIVKSKHTPTVYLCYPVPSEQHLKERSNLEGFEVPAQIPTSDVL